MCNLKYIQPCTNGRDVCGSIQKRISMAKSKGPMRRTRYRTYPEYIESQLFPLGQGKAVVRINEKENTMYILHMPSEVIAHSALGVDLKQLKELADEFLYANGIKQHEHQKPIGYSSPIKRDL